MVIIFGIKKKHIIYKNQSRLLRPLNMDKSLPGSGFLIFKFKKWFKSRSFKFNGKCIYEKCDDLFITLKKFLENNSLKKDYDCLVVDIHGEITSEKMAIGIFRWKSIFSCRNTYTCPNKWCKNIKNGTGYMTDAGMCGDYDSVIGMDKNNSIKRFFKEDSIKHFPSKGRGIYIRSNCWDVNKETGLAIKIKSFITGGVLNNTNSLWQVILIGQVLNIKKEEQIK